ncbi:MAG: hypothetical protein JWP63_1032, partial [Candidatus Solibacter sp.]|nr:hypothetical protein [Candidatus Solibacter sp.]
MGRSPARCFDERSPKPSRDGYGA